jgi:HEAT repeat protein
MGFDMQNIGIGLLAGWGSAYVVYRSRNGIQRVIRAARGSAANMSASATQSADRRYVHDLLAQIDSSGMLGPHLPLRSVLVEPRFIPARRLDADDADVQNPDLYAGVPLVHEYPWLHAPFHLETLGLSDVANASAAIAVLGLPGSGRTTALFALALHAIGRIAFEQPPDKVQARLEREEAALTEKERAVRVNERIVTEQRARERLASERGELEPGHTEAPQGSAGRGGTQRVPVYAHLADVLGDPADFSDEVDPAEPLVRALQSSLGRVTASTLPREIYRWLGRGLVLALIDGYDELSEADQARARAWLAAFRAQYDRNSVIVTGGVAASGALTQLGFTPVYMRPWSDQDVAMAVRRFAAAPRPLERGAKAAILPDAEAVQRAGANTRALTSAEITLKIAANLTNTAELPGMEGWVRGALARLLPAGQSWAELSGRLARMAALQLDEGSITAARMLALAIDGQHEGGDDARPEASPGVAKGATNQARLLRALEKSGLLVQRRSERYQFRHALYTAYLASLYLKTAGNESRLLRQEQPAWAQAFALLALHTPVDDLVRQRMAGPQDILQTRLLEPARWLAFAPADASWRGPYLRALTSAFTAPVQYPLLRERAAAALAGTREPGALAIFRQGARSANPEVRRLACLGIGALGGTEAVRDLRSLLDDRNPDVAVAAAMALGAVGGEEALQALLVGLTQGDEQLRQVIAEALATLPEDGYPILFEAIDDEDMLVRRAAVFGLRRIRATWAVIAIYRAFLEDDQWYVRSAAQQAFEEIQYGRPSRIEQARPAPHELDWLTLWAAHRGESVPAGPASAQILARVLKEGNAEERTLAALTLGALGTVDSLKPLYAALRDRQDAVRAAAYRALGALQEHTDTALPLPA